MAHYAGRHRTVRRLPLARLAMTAMAGSFCLGLGSAMPALPPAPVSAAPIAHVTLASSTESLGGRMLDQAETRTGDWYAWGATGPSAFDCSGLVYWSAGRLGLRFPRDTWEMAHSPRIVQTWHPQRGDLAFWGPRWAPYHVEFVTVWYQTTFGAQNWGTRVGWHYHWPGWRPSWYGHVIW